MGNRNFCRLVARAKATRQNWLREKGTISSVRLSARARQENKPWRPANQVRMVDARYLLQSSQRVVPAAPTRVFQSASMRRASVSEKLSCLSQQKEFRMPLSIPGGNGPRCTTQRLWRSGRALCLAGSPHRDRHSTDGAARHASQIPAVSASGIPSDREVHGVHAGL